MPEVQEVVTIESQPEDVCYYSALTGTEIRGVTRCHYSAVPGVIGWLTLPSIEPAGLGLCFS